MFPVIRHIDDVLPHIEGKDEIVHLDRGVYQVLDYVYITPDTFDNPYALECRGLKFDENGYLIARPFQKFFNLNEKPCSAIETLDWSQHVDVMPKLDGSMIHPAMANGVPVLMTRKGVSPTAIQATIECDVPWDEMIKYMKMGITPIYEYISPNNRIVLDYDRPSLEIIGLRYNLTGQYEPLMKYESTKIDDPKTFVDMARKLEGAEGYVLAWENGHRVKIKADEYVLLHRNIDLAGSEARVMEVILEDKLDDLLPMLDEKRRAELEEFAGKVNESIALHTKDVKDGVEDNAHLSQKDFALGVQRYFDKRLRAAYFRGRSTGDYRGAVIEVFKRLFSKQSSIDENRDLINGAFLKSRPM